MAWRDPQKMEEAQSKIAEESHSDPSLYTEIFVAEEETGDLLGFIEVKLHKDFLSGIEQGNIEPLQFHLKVKGRVSVRA